MRERGPHLLAADQPAAAGGVADRARAHIGQVRARAGLRIALAPERGAVADAGQQARLLVRGAEGDQGRADQPFTDMAHAARAAGARVFLVEDHLLHHRQLAPAMRARPAQPGPAALGQAPFPRLAQFGEGLFVAGAAAVLQAGKLAGQVGGHPLRHLGAECLLFMRAHAVLQACGPWSARYASAARAPPSQWPAACARLK
ncbi:hypothetical protein D9M72_552890 [compost metagenome]